MKEEGKSGRNCYEAVKIASGNVDAKLEVWREKHKEKGEGSKDMKGFNRIVMMGRLTRDPQVRQIASGRSVSDLGLAVAEAYKNKDGEITERVCFVDIVTWGKQAEACGEYLKKGSPILVEGRLQLNTWETSDGQKRSKHRVSADRIEFLNGNKANSHSDKKPALAGSAAVDDNTPF